MSRTTNAIEGWHNSSNRSVKVYDPYYINLINYIMLIRNLILKQSGIRLQLRRKHRLYEERNLRLYNMVMPHDRNNTKDFLIICSQVLS